MDRWKLIKYTASKANQAWDSFFGNKTPGSIKGIEDTV
jgi:hypothetical protein